MKDKLKNVHEIVSGNVGSEIISYNNGKDSTQQINSEDIYNLSRKQEDVKIILNILSKLDEFNKKTGRNFNKSNLQKLCSNQKNLDWITAYQNVVLTPLLNDYTKIAQKMKNTKKQMSDLIKDDKYKLKEIE